ncbi:S26 family signal peptidase [Lysinibacter cavernae]|uniref:Signal peptidase n=1 Tax=Lysinibacter cavernae TaxID=1640652 RepID=A0A7X5TS10_9MICO|nr:S26 family signal peptidase [Lysinibacter cavernae]NIH52911.1 signal peptidase [Lysinibacter cavernae]
MIRRRSWPLTVLAALGTLSLVGFACSLLFGIRLFAFQTDSMEPTVPRGALGVSIRESAEDIGPGDIVTVTRENALPVTHRVITATPSGGRVDLVLRGDGNSANDATVYSVTEVHRLLTFVPLVGYAVGAALSQPLFLGFATVALAALVTWYWWPTAAGRHAGGSRSGADTGSQ